MLESLQIFGADQRRFGFASRLQDHPGLAIGYLVYETGERVFRMSDTGLFCSHSHHYSHYGYVVKPQLQTFASVMIRCILTEDLSNTPLASNFPKGISTSAALTTMSRLGFIDGLNDRIGWNEPRDGTTGTIGTLSSLNVLNGAKRLNVLNDLNALTNPSSAEL